MAWFRRSKKKGPPKRPGGGNGKERVARPSATARTADLRVFEGRKKNFDTYIEMFGEAGEGDMSSATAAIGELVELNKMKPGSSEVRQRHGKLQGALDKRRTNAQRKRNLQDMLEIDELRIDGAIMFEEPDIVKNIAQDYFKLSRSASAAGRQQESQTFVQASNSANAIADSLERKGAISQQFTQFFSGGKAAKERAKADAIDSSKKLFANLRQKMIRMGQISPPRRPKK